MPLTYAEQTEIISIIHELTGDDQYKILSVIEKDACPKTVTKHETIFDITKLSERTTEKLRKMLL